MSEDIKQHLDADFKVPVQIVLLLLLLSLLLLSLHVHVLVFCLVRPLDTAFLCKRASVRSITVIYF